MPRFVIGLADAWSVLVQLVRREIESVFVGERGPPLGGEGPSNGPTAEATNAEGFCHGLQLCVCFVCQLHVRAKCMCPHPPAGHQLVCLSQECSRQVQEVRHSVLAQVGAMGVPAHSRAGQVEVQPAAETISS